MNTAKFFREAGSGCCLILPLIGVTSAVAEPALSTEMPSSVDPTYPVVGFQPSPVAVQQTGSLLVEAALDGEIPTGAQSTLPFESTDDFQSESPMFDRVATTGAIAEQNSSDFGVLLVELHTTVESAPVSTLVKGAENGEQALAFDQWLLPFDDVVKALGFTPSIEVDGKVTLRSPEIVTQIQLESLPVDPELGVMWSIADIAEQLGASAEFDRANYKIQFNHTASNQNVATPLASRSENPAYAALSTVYPTIEKDEEIPNLESTLATEDSLQATLPATEQIASSQLGVLLVGLAIDEITTVEATLVKGREDGEQAIALDQWLIPFDDAMIALGANVTLEEDGLMAIRAPGLATVLDPQLLSIDPDLGQAISIALIEEKLGISAEFDLGRYAVKFSPLSLNQPTSKNVKLRFPTQLNVQDAPARPVVTTGLQTVSPSSFSLSALTQSTRASSSRERLINEPVGQLSALGSAFGGSWYARVDQPSLSNYSSWQLQELQYLRQGDREDYVLGSQPTFWRSRNTGQSYWGATTVQRWGFTAPNLRSEGGFSPRSRLQSNKIGRTVSGEAAPGTFVQLTRGLNGPVINEVIVNSSGLYRFENVPAGRRLSNQLTDRGYLVQLYPNGQLTSQPEIRSAAFTTLPGQLPKGASALIASAGVGHRDSSARPLGSFDTFRGGVAYRYGLSESLTLGAGLVQDKSTQILAEGFYLPEGLPLQAAFSATVDMQTGDAEIDANLRYQPTKALRLTFDSDRFSQRLQADWKLSPNISLSALGDTRDNTWSVEGRADYQLNRWRGRAIASIDTRQNLRWSLYADNGALNVSHQGSEISTYSRATYQLPNQAGAAGTGTLGHELSLTHQTFNASANLSSQARELSAGNLSVGLKSSSLTTAEWRYRSRQQAADGHSRWRGSIGYGISSRRSGLVASAAATIGSGLELAVRYQSVSLFDESRSLQVSLVSRLNTQNGLGWGYRRQNELRTQGGLKLQPFFDTNTNGIRDDNEPLYLDTAELLMVLNNNNVNNYRSEIQADGLLLSLSPDTYRLDIDPAGLPIDKTAVEMSYAVEVVPGQYTKLEVPLVNTYAISGVVIDKLGLTVPGAQVEVVSVSGHRQQSITNGAGVYYLERLQPETYELSVNGILLEDSSIVLEGDSDTFLEKEIRLL